MAEVHYGAHGRHFVFSKPESEQVIAMSAPKQQYGGEIGEWLGNPFYLGQCPWDCDNPTHFEVTPDNLASLLR